MADNVMITAGSGTTVATDDVSGVQFQRVKLTLGADGVNAGDLQAVLNVAIASNTTDEAATGAAGTLFGYSIKEDAASTATLVIRDGTSNSDTAVSYINLASDESVRDWFGPQGIKITTGIWIERVTGTSSLTIWYI